MKYTNCVVLFILLCFAAFSQQPAKLNIGKLMGRVMDSASRQPIEYATIMVFSIGKKQPISGGATNSKGFFTIDNLPLGTYKMVIDFIGYKTRTESGITLTTEQPTLYFESISLLAKAQTLNEVTVESKKSLIENHIDKLVYNAERDVTSQGGVATDVLRKVPQVSVDINGNVQLQGS